MNRPQPSSYLSHSLTQTAALQTACVCVWWLRVKKWLALLVLFITVKRADTPAPLPFILISILNDKPSQSHSRPVCTPPPPPTSSSSLVSTLPKTPARQQQCSFVCTPPSPPPSLSRSSCPLALPRTMLVGGDGGMPRQERARRKGREGMKDGGRERLEKNM